MYCIYQDHLITNLRVKCVIQIFDLYDQSGQGFITFREVLDITFVPQTYMYIPFTPASSSLILSQPFSASPNIDGALLFCVPMRSVCGSIRVNIQEQRFQEPNESSLQCM
jgi:hypothetical protein